MGPSVLVVDDQVAFRVLARNLLLCDGFVVVGEAGDGAEALLQHRALHPDVVLLDVRLPDASGLDVARSLRAAAVPPVVVLMSTADYAHAVSGCGARAFLPKADLSGPALRVALAAGA
jgi:DNA-binding NarL/FixJ family response regulator